MATTIGISLPFDLMVFALIYTLIKGRIRFTTPFLFAFGSLVLFIVGGITGVFLGAVVLDYEFRGTYWVVAHFHYVMVGGATALFAAIYYWFPKITGKMYDEVLGKVHFGMFFVGFNLLYFPMFFAWETPRRVFDYKAAYIPWHQLATVGGFLLGASFLVMFYNFYRSLQTGEDVDGNPWRFSTTAEWAISSPPPLENFEGIASYEGGRFSEETPTADGGEASDASRPSSGPRPDGGAAAHADAHDAHVEEHADHVEEHADHASIWPLVIAGGLFLSFIGASGFNGGEIPGAGYLFVLASGVAVLGGGLLAMARESFVAPEPEWASQWPFSGINNNKLGMWIFLGSDVVLFGAFIGSYAFIRFGHGWIQWHELVPADHVVLPGLINTYLLLTSSFTVVLALVAARRGSRWGTFGSLVATFLLGIGFLVNKAIEWQHLFHVHSDAFAHGWTPTTNVASSTFYLTTGLHGAHVIVGLLIALYMIARSWNGAYANGDDEPIELFGLYWHFVDIVWLFLFPLFYIL
jgi:cytochrome c oxidase subunit I+III